jgi:hypothetical protein
MINKANAILIAAVAALGIASPALAQSAYTSGATASNAAAGYPSPSEHTGDLYAYAPGHFTAAPFHERQRGQATSSIQAGH